jgi:hypothetical protein
MKRAFWSFLFLGFISFAALFILIVFSYTGKYILYLEEQTEFHNQKLFDSSKWYLTAVTGKLLIFTCHSDIHVINKKKTPTFNQKDHKRSILYNIIVLGMRSITKKIIFFK